MKPTAMICLGWALAVAPGCDQVAQKVFDYEVPTWTSVVHLSDGRVFVTDEYIALDVAWANPAELPTKTFPAEGIESVVQHHQRSGNQVTFNVNSVQDVGVDGAYRGRGGILMDPKYIDYLRWQFATHDVELFAGSIESDVVILIDGEFAGALAPMTLER